MKVMRALIQACLFCELLLALPATVQAQFTFTTNNGAITITRYTGSDGTATIPSTTNGFPVTSIEMNSFANIDNLTNVIIPYSITNIGLQTFYLSANLTNIAVDALNPDYSSVDGVLFDKSQTTLIECPEGKLGAYVIPDGVTNIARYSLQNCNFKSVAIPNSVISIGDYAFQDCHGLTSVVIPNSVISLGSGAFSFCYNLAGAYFKGNQPSITLFESVFDNDNTAIVYYLPGTTGWGTTFGGRPTVLWNPQAATGDGSFGVRTNQFGFNITGSSNLVIVVEACTNLASSSWSAVGTNTLTGGSSYFSDPVWTNYPARFYRFRSP